MPQPLTFRLFFLNDNSFLTLVILDDFSGKLNAPTSPPPPYRKFHILIPTDTGLMLYLFQITVYFRHLFVDDDDYDDDDYDDEMMLLKVERD